MVGVRLGRIFIAVFAMAVFTSVGTAEAQRRGAPTSFADLAEVLTPAVVNISSAKNAGGAQPSGASRQLLRKFSRPAVSLGSGFIIDETGLVVTNNHVIDNADEITVTLSDGREFNATLRGRDRETDLAVLQLDGGSTKFPFVEFGDDSKSRVGDWVVTH